ncbi:hypothetical protein JVU11DRAFT_3824 [Chiua virens]|nr:hypothetical protein JVU11DRAFT_3824 [Chiua virens]
MFFLQELELRLQPCLDTIQEIDNFRVLALIGLSAKAQCDKALASQHPTILDGFNQTAMFPIGPNPILILKEWRIPGSLQHQPVILAHLFCQFTTQTWLMVHNTALKGVEPMPTSLADAMKYCNTGLETEDGIIHGCQGPHSMSFSSHKDIYFPAQEAASPKAGSQRLSFWENNGYIKAYHGLLKEWTEEDMFYLNDGLGTIFSHLQSLPASQKPTRKTKGFIWHVKMNSFVFYTNPKYYKVEGLGKELKENRRPMAKQTAHCQLKSRKVFEEVLWHSNGFDGLASKQVETDRKLRCTRLQRLGTVAKNKRKPPQQTKIPPKDFKPTEL